MRTRKALVGATLTDLTPVSAYRIDRGEPTVSETNILSGSLTTAYRLGWDAGRAGLVSRPPFMGEHAQWLWRNGYAAGVASIEATECECSEEYGPCEDHSEVLAQRDGASTRTGDELLAVFIGDAEGIIGRPITEWDASAVAAEYWEATDNAGGWVDHDRFPDLAEALHDAAIYGAESALYESGASVSWEDGYVISRITGGPLLEEDGDR